MSDSSTNLPSQSISEWDELEARSLMSAVTNGAQDSLPPSSSYSPSRLGMMKPKSFSFFSRIQIIILLALCALVLIFKEDIIGLVALEEEVDTIGKIPVEELKRLVLASKKDFEELLREDYGIYAQDVFRTDLVLKYFKTPSDVLAATLKQQHGGHDNGDNMDKSRERLKRRLKIKVIESQIGQSRNNATTTATTMTSFTWVVGGHSAAAGHGNLFRQAYANVIEQSLKGIFGSLGIQFYAKNYAMGGTKSAPEVALCMESIFGRDLDVISWDYGMTDGRSPELYRFWTQRAGVHPTRPILFSYGQRYSDTIHKEVEDAGGAGFEMNFLNAKTMFPNSDDGSVDVSTLPRAVKNYLCNNGHVESGEPCGDPFVKYDTNHTCPNIKGQVSWHNGWKDHLFIGRISAAFLLENVVEAMDELTESHENLDHDADAPTGSSNHNVIQPSISSSYLSVLKELERKDREAFFQSPPPEDIFEKKQFLPDAQFHHFSRSRSFCRTAILPSQARYDGVVLGDKGNQQPANYLYAGKTDYQEEGYDIFREGLPLEEPENNQTEPYLVYNLKHSREICSEADIDFKDAFYVRFQDKWMTTTVPNDAEEAYFTTFVEQQPQQPQPQSQQPSFLNAQNGIIMLCTVPFDWGKYTADYVTISEMVATFNQTTHNETTTTEAESPEAPVPPPLVENHYGIVVNDIRVTDAILVHEERCFVLKHGPGESGYFFPPNSRKRFDIQFHLPRPGNLYLSSIIVL